MNRPGGRAGRLQAAVANFINLELVEILEGRSKGTRLTYPDRHPGTGGSDAKADQREASVGGWWSEQAKPKQWEVQWFALRITKARFQWAYDKVSPQRRIAALELLGTLFLLRLAAKNVTAAELDVTVRGVTDSQCNSFALLKNYSRKLPLAAVHMELMATAGYFSIWPRISHVPREQNTWADDLTEFKTESFNPRLRWEPRLTPDFFFVLDKLLDTPGHAS